MFSGPFTSNAAGGRSLRTGPFIQEIVCKSRKTPRKDYLVAKIDVDTAENKAVRESVRSKVPIQISFSGARVGAAPGPRGSFMNSVRAVRGGAGGNAGRSKLAPGLDSSFPRPMDANPRLSTPLPPPPFLSFFFRAHCFKNDPGKDETK